MVGQTTSMTMTSVFPVQPNYGGGTQDAFAMKLSQARASSVSGLFTEGSNRWL